MPGLDGAPGDVGDKGDKGVFVACLMDGDKTGVYGYR